MKVPQIITPEWVREQVERVRHMAGDDEAAHAEEDDLHQAVLQKIADNDAAEPSQCAREALRSQSITFARWCA